VAECDLKAAYRMPSELQRQVPLVASLPLRLPTLEEAMSLLTPEPNDEGDHRTRYLRGSSLMLTCDIMPAPPWMDDVTLLVWVADFLSTDVQPVPIESAWPVWLVASD
jgi:hypothetical protein